MLVVDISIERDFKPVVSIARRQSLVEVNSARVVFLCIGKLLCYVADEMIVSDARIGADIPVCCCVNGSIEGEASVDVPVAIDVLWSGDITSGIGIVSYKV